MLLWMQPEMIRINLRLAFLWDQAFNESFMVLVGDIKNSKFIK